MNNDLLALFYIVLAYILVIFDVFTLYEAVVVQLLAMSTGAILNIEKQTKNG